MTHRGPFQPLLFCDSVIQTDLGYAVTPTEAIPDLSSSPKFSQFCCIPSDMGRLKLHPASKTQEHGRSVLQHHDALFPFLVISWGLLAFLMLLSDGLVLSWDYPSKR